MNKQFRKATRRLRQTHQSLRVPTVVRLAVLAGLVAIGGVGVTQQTRVNAAQTTAAYCSQYSVNSQKNACQDGIQGVVNCGDYAITFDQATADICTAARNAKAGGQISDTPSTSPSPSPTNGTSNSPSPSPSNSTSTSPSPAPSNSTSTSSSSAPSSSTSTSASPAPSSSTNPFSLQDLITQTNNLSSMIDQADAAVKSTGIGGCSGGSTGSGSSSSSSSTSDPSAAISAFAGLFSGAAGGGSSSSSSTGTSSGGSSSSSSGSGSSSTTSSSNGGGSSCGSGADNNLDSYINGAGKPQKIKVYQSGQQNSPAIVFFNGGGWHADDGTSDAVATNSPNKNGLPNGPTIGSVVGPGAIARGYTLIEVTYRLGSDGVYYMFDDVLRGLRHVINNAKGYGIDPSKVAIWGDSAGGSLSMRVAATGKSGAKAAVGWSAPTNGYTALFSGYKDFLIGMDHSTCIPTDLAGAANTSSLLTGGSGNVVQEGQGLASNSFDSLSGLTGGGGSSGSGNPLGIITDVLTAAQAMAKTSQNVESISQQLLNGGVSSLGGGVMNLASQKLVECIDNFNVLSPALFASPDTPPSFLAGFELDDIIHPDQEYGMRDKLRSMGIRSEALVLHGDPNAYNQAFGASDNHLGYDPQFVCGTLDFLDSVIQPDKASINCATGFEGS